MSKHRLFIRRLITAGGVIAVLAIGVGSIRAAAAWTAASAPLTVAPVSIATLETRLADEQARSEVLTLQLLDMNARAQDLEVALEEAHGRIESDTEHATDLEAQLAAAKKQLAATEKAIAKARRTLAAQAGQAVAPKPATTSGSSHDDDHDDEDEEDDEPDETPEPKETPEPEHD
jgi:peptidoglycan hydrolase CwlO-like protein